LRLDFYENWLHSEGLRDGSIGLAPMQGVLGFLRTEGAAYDRVMERAGRLAAEWSLMNVTGGRRRLIASLPRWFRVRAALRLAREIALSISSGARVAVKVRGTSARVEFGSSVFCTVRGVQPAPLCGFYRALVLRTLEEFALPAGAAVTECRAMGAPLCLVSLDLSAGRQAGEAAAA
jgi:hypothetical protein